MKSSKLSSKKIPDSPVKSAIHDQFQWHSWLVFAVGAVIYLNTLMHQFTQDDAIVIYDNMYTTKGIAGLKGLFTKDTFFGFFKEEGKAKLVSGGRYRPFTPAMFAVEYELAGKNPLVGHLINILLYGFLCFMIYKVLFLLICHKDGDDSKKWLVLTASLLYSTHPIHTEAVANIKGRDEIMSMLGSIFALYFIVKNFDSPKTKYLVLAVASFFIAFLSKENTITFLAVIPLALYFFRDQKLGSAISKSAILILPTIIFLMIRSAILGNDFGGTPMELMNNPYLKLVGSSYVPFDIGEKMATIVYSLGKYIQLLVFPHPLTHDYYPRYIDIKTFGDIGVLLSLAIYAGLAFLAIKGFKTRSIVGFSAAYFLITLSIVSNVVFPIGTNMSERFMFMPSLGFALGVASLMEIFIFRKTGKNVFIVTLGIIVGLYTLKTVTRNMVWKDDFTLFTTDVKTSTNSAKVLNAAAGALTTEAFTEKDEAKKKSMLDQALIYINKAVEVHPQYKNAYLIMGNVHYYLKDFDKSISAYQKVLDLDPNFTDGITNLAITLRDAGRQAGEVNNDLIKAESYLTRSYQLSANDPETTRLLGVLNGIKGNHSEAIKYFTKVLTIEPNGAGGYLNLSLAYRNIGDITNADNYMQKALALDPEIMNKQGRN